MEITGDAKLLRIFISSTDKFKHAPLYEVVVFAAKRYGLAGATVLKGFMGYGSSSMVHSQKLWDITEKLPVVIEIIDEGSKIDGFVESILPYFEKIPKGGLITLENTTIVLHKPGTKKSFF
jgi:PII-like signaling protein